MDINKYTPSYSVAHKHMVSLADYSTEEIFEILYAVKTMKSKFIARDDTLILRGTTIVLLFGDTSLRTRSALEIGIRQLGGDCVNLPYSSRDMDAGENIKDIVDVIARYGVGALITRGISHDDLTEYCKVSNICILNSGNEDAVPMQTFCDLFTIWEKFRQLEGLKIAYVGKGSANACSLISGAVKCGMEVSVAVPEQFAIGEAQLDSIRQYGNILITENPVEAVRGADIIYTENYNYHKNLSEKELKTLSDFQVNRKLFELAKPTACFMHPLPAGRGVEVTEEIIDGKNSLTLAQGENKLHAIKAILAMLIR